MKRLTYHSPLGPLILLAKAQDLVGVWFAGQKHEGAHYNLTAVSTGEIPVLKQTYQWLDRYFAGQQPAISELSLAPQATTFQRQVYQVLTEIPYGQTMSYQAIVDQLTQQNGCPTGSARAVGGAVGHNPISIIIPCHRVVGSDGSLTGYAGGLERKKALLAFESQSKLA